MRSSQRAGMQGLAALGSRARGARAARSKAKAVRARVLSMSSRLQSLHELATTSSTGTPTWSLPHSTRAPAQAQAQASGHARGSVMVAAAARGVAAHDTVGVVEDADGRGVMLSGLKV